MKKIVILLFVISISFTNAFPQLSFTYQNTCFNDTTEFSFDYVGSKKIVFLLWDFGDTIATYSDTNDIIQPHVYGTVDTFYVMLTTLYSDGSRDTVIDTVEILPLPEFTLEYSGDKEFFEGKSVDITAVGTFASAAWSSGENTTIITVEESGHYTATVTGNNGCKDSLISSYIFVKLVHDLKPVSLFTPNNDGYNEKWEITNIEAYDNVEVYVYNRWNTQVYSSTSYQNDWDGMSNGKQLPDGTYYYFAKTNTGKEYKGTVNILK